MTEEELFKSHLLDLGRQSERQSRYTYSAFLGLPEQDAYFKMASELKFVSHRLYSPLESSERKIAVFGSPEELGYEPDYPLSLLKVTPNSLKFAEELTHRDYLGAILNLGIERELIGDILIKEKIGYVFCLDSIKEFLTDSLKRIRHTDVTVVETNFNVPDLAPVFKEVTYNVSSPRIDALVAEFCALSRSKASELFSKERVFVNGKIVTSLSYNMKEQDVLTVRGFGKAIYNGIGGTSKKGRLYVTLKIYQ